MNPSTLDLPSLATLPAVITSDSTSNSNSTQPPHSPADRSGFELGWDHAQHGLVPPAELLVDGTPIGQGWRAGKAVFGRRSGASTRTLRLWLQLRTKAWLAGVCFDVGQVTPAFLAKIAVGHCPVTRQPLGGAPGSHSAPVTVCLRADLGYRAGNLAVLSQRAAEAIAGLDSATALRQAERRDADACNGYSDSDSGPLNAAEAGRLAVLLSLATPLPFCQATRLPLRLLPPPQLRPANPVQVLQALLTQQFSAPGWSARLRAVADLLPQSRYDTALRHDFNLFVGAVAPRLLAAGVGPGGHTLPQALEDLWADLRVGRRWQQFAAALGESGVDQLLLRIDPGAAAAGDRSQPAAAPTAAPTAKRRATAARAVSPAPAPLASRRRTNRPPPAPAVDGSARHRAAAR